MKAIILVGGEGTRLRPLTYSLVKSMVPVLNRPFIEHVICNLVRHNVSEIILAMGYKPDSIYKYFKADIDGGKQDEFAHIKTSHNKGFNLTYSQEEKPLGTAGAVKLAGSHVDDTFLVLNGDIFSDIDYTAMLKFHKTNQSMATIALTHVDDPTKFGVVETDQAGKIQRFIEKPSWDQVTSHWINAGVYILEPGVLDYIPDGEFYMFERGVFPTLLNKKAPMYAYTGKEYWIDMGTPAKYLQLNCDILDGKCTSPLYKSGPVTIGKESRVDPSAGLSGPIIIGDSCTIGKQVKIQGPVVIGSGCIIEDNTVIQNSVLWDHITAGRGAYIINSVIASGDTIEANRKLDGQIINHEAPVDTAGN